MKSRVFDKRLVLNKKTITNLGKTEMVEAYGGGPTNGMQSCATNCFATFCVSVCIICPPTTLCPTS